MSIDDIHRHLNEFRPWKVRLLARAQTGTKRKPRVLSNLEISEEGQLKLSEVVAISMMDSWDNLTLRQISGFIAGCRFSPFSSSNRNAARSYLNKNPKWIYLRESDIWESEILPVVSNAQRMGWLTK